ncbi:MAG TPA: flagellar assembly peptidoglycan hydrolase FlgJ [Pseudorhodoplanes sp.]|jgi:Rod binding domain-containing protein|nr:flagellar assembly peptidoglycan hydrolase FlgJ [Pseudorhodoplanes sp.]
MAAYISLEAPRPSTPLLSLSQQETPAKIRARLNSPEKARAAAQDFESVFLATMFSQMTTATGSEGPFGDGPATGVWRSMLTQEYAKAVAKNGGIGIADHVYRSLLGQQEVAR